MKNNFTEAEMKAFAPAEKLGIIATVTPEGLPHMTLLTSVMAAKTDQLIVGEFCQGKSKEYMQRSAKIGFAILTLDKKLWRGKAQWTHLKKEGPEYEIYNNQPMFRYNTYFGINTVHYFDLKETTEGRTLPLASVVKSALLTKMAKGGAAKGNSERVLSHFGEKLFNGLDSIKFLSFIGDDGYPVIIPAIQSQAADSSRLAFHPGAFGDELNTLKPGMTVAVFCLTMQMEDVLVRGIFNGYCRYRGVNLGTLDIDWVYNSMPPNHGQIY
ncbi:MAG: hypothetical protein WCO53_04720, partial [Deltaproteobacteria bacterium]